MFPPAPRCQRVLPFTASLPSAIVRMEDSVPMADNAGEMSSDHRLSFVRAKNPSRFMFNCSP
ncbi:MAG TPA: hypothetical protein H9752_05230 [Candidatus Phocaeicola excrementigallinarum]|nr:hypothetical protein [Candidatus Phocaeicola excrementigallinarum]